MTCDVAVSLEAQETCEDVTQAKVSPYSSMKAEFKVVENVLLDDGA